MQIKQGQYNLLWLCAHCGNDFRAWLQIPGEDRREFLRQRPQYEITHLLENCCPRCSYPYQNLVTCLSSSLALAGEKPAPKRLPQ